MRESEFQTRLLKKLRKRGLFYKIWGGGFQQAGIPDIIGCYKGIFLGIELKTDVGKVSELQQYHLNKIKENGGYGIVIRPKNEDELWNLLDDIDKRGWYE